MAKKQGDREIIARAIRYCTTHLNQIITQREAALEFYGRGNLQNQKKSVRIISAVRKYFRQEHPEWHLHIASVRGIGWYVTDNPHDALIDLIQPETMMRSYGERYIEELEAVDVNGLDEKLKEAVYKARALGNILEELEDKFGEFSRKVVKLIPIKELKRRQIKGMRVPRMLLEKIEEN